jgi:alkyldihydroxyacetonephosphate synthase
MAEKPWIDELRTLLGDENVSTKESELSAYGYDHWPVAVKWKNQGKLPYCPDAIAQPGTVSQVSRLLAWANRNQIAVTPRGAGSGVTGAATPTGGGILLDLSAMNRLLALDEHNLLVKAQAGMLGGTLENALKARGYTLNHSPQSLDRSSVGGWLATRAVGQFSSRWGGIEDLAAGCTVVLASGEIVEIKPAPRAATGPDLRQLFLGSEGTLGVIVDVTLKIFPLPECRLLEAVHFERFEQGFSAVRKIMRLGLRPFLVRLYDPEESQRVTGDPGYTGCILFLGCEGLQPVAQAEQAACIQICQAEGGKLLGPDPVSAWMERRFDFSAVENLLQQPGGFAETIEIAHFWDQLLETYLVLKQHLAPLAGNVFGHLSHVYPQGSSLYVILTGQVEDDGAAEARLVEIWDVAMRICLEKGAVISHHHGIGLARLPYIRESLGSSFTLLERVKSALDPAGILNPDKLGLS